MRIAVLGALIAAVTVTAAVVVRAGDDDWRTAVFLVLGFAQLGVALALRPAGAARHNPFLAVAVLSAMVLHASAVLLPPLQALLETEPLGRTTWLTCLALAAVPGTLAWSARVSRGLSVTTAPADRRRCPSSGDLVLSSVPGHDEPSGDRGPGHSTRGDGEMSTATTEQDNVTHEPELRRVMGRKLLLLFIVGDILGAGVYAVTGQMAGIVGGIVWVPFVIAFVVAALTAMSYLELVTKYPQAAGAALYTHKAFGIHFVTFLVAFAVICSGITSASTSSTVLAQNLTGGLVVNGWLDEEPSTGVITLIAMAFMVLLALINLRGVGESVKFNVVLTLVEITALAIVIGVGFWAIAQGDGDLSRVTTFSSPEDKGVFLAVTAATAVAFFAMVGFEDSVNMVEECKDPERIFPRTMLTGLGITVIIYVLVAFAVVAVLTPGELAKINESEGRRCSRSSARGRPTSPSTGCSPSSPSSRSPTPP